MRPILFSLCLLLTAAAFGQSGTFDIVSKEKVIGHTSYTLEETKSGYRLKSKYTLKINGVDTNVTDDFRLAQTYVYLDGSATNMVNQMHTAYTPNKQRTQLVIAQVQGGVQESHNLSIKPNFAVLPNYDAGAAQALLLLAAPNPLGDEQYNILIPASSASGPPASQKDDPGAAQIPGGNNAYDSVWAKGSDTTGTLDGKPVAVHTWVLAAGKSRTTFYADGNFLLLQVDASQLRASYIRTKFKLDTPATP